MNIRTRLVKVENNIKESKKKQSDQVLFADKNIAADTMEIYGPGPRQLFSGSIKEGEKFLKSIEYSLCIIDDIPDTRCG